MKPHAESRLLAHVSRFAWVLVSLYAAAISWWSLFELGRSYGLPPVLAGGVSLVFDGAAFITARLAHQYALSQDSGAFARFVLFALLAGSVVLNWKHGEALGLPWQGSLMFSTPAAVAIVLFELHAAWTSRETRRASGRVADKIPPLGRWSWIFHPLCSFNTVWQISHGHAQAARKIELARIADKLPAVSALPDSQADRADTGPDSPDTNADRADSTADTAPGSADSPDNQAGNADSVVPILSAPSAAVRPLWIGPADTGGQPADTVLTSADSEKLSARTGTQSDLVRRLAGQGVRDVDTVHAAVVREFGQSAKRATTARTLRRVLPDTAADNADTADSRTAGGYL